MTAFEKDEIMREIREGYIVFSAYAIEKTWWDSFWGKLTISDDIPKVDPIDNTPLM
jgi:hypothetical protein